MTKNNTPDFITLPLTFDGYKWYKPIMTFIVALIFFIIFQVIVIVVSSGIYGFNTVLSVAMGGYESMNTEAGQIISDLSIIVTLPSIYLASKIVKDRPFSSYASSRGGFNVKLYFKALIIPLILYIVYEIVNVFVVGTKGTNHFSIIFFILVLICVPLQCIAEEFAFRGLIMQSIGSWVKIPLLVIVIQSVIFALLHGYNSLGVIEVFIMGIFYGFFTWKTNGIEVSSALHTVNNLVIAIVVMFGLEKTTSTIEPVDLLTSIVFQVAICAILYYVGNKTNWFGEIE